MEIYRGTATFSGIAIGKILYYQKGELSNRDMGSGSFQNEMFKFESAKKRVIFELQQRYDQYMQLDSETREDAQVFSRQIHILETGSFERAVESLIKYEKMTAAQAIQITRDELTTTFRSLSDQISVNRISDIREISDRMIGAMGGFIRKIDLGDVPIILTTEQLTPAELMEMDKTKILAVVTQSGSAVSHTSIMTKTMGVPSLIEVDVSPEWDGQMAIVDGYTGTIYIDPDKNMIEQYEVRQKADLERKEELLKYCDLEDVTLDGTKVALYSNIGNLDDMDSVIENGADGIGLLRSEFQYLGRDNYPRENDLFRVYKQIAERMGDKVVAIRVFDLGADKKSEYMDIPEEVNPILGNRGIRLCLDRERMFKAQLRAIYRASVYGNLSMMFPMITSEEEIIRIEKILEEVKTELNKKGLEYKNIRRGIMIETPASVMISRELAKHVDYLSIGTNDLTQYTLAMDKQNPLLRGKFDDHHPAIFRMIEMTVKAGHAENCEVGIAGELAGDPELTEQFLRMGVDALSVAPVSVLEIRKAIRNIDLSK